MGGTINLDSQAQGPGLNNMKLSHLQKNRTPFHILLVEDNPINQKIIVHMLSLVFNCSVIIASSGAEAIKLFDKNLDLILLDIGLPDISGFEVAEALNERMASEGFSVPLISLTAHADVTQEHPLYKKLGFSGALIKPVQMQVLKELISKILIK